MASFTLESLANSFIQWNGGTDVSVVDDNVAAPSINPGGRDGCTDCEEEADYCLPINEITDIAFQFIMDGVSEEKAGDFAIGVYNGCDCDFYGEVTDDNFIEVFTPTYEELSTNRYVFSFSPSVSIDLCDLLATGDKITLVLFDISLNYAVACSTCFRFFADRCYTAIIRYKNPTNAFGFYYEEAGASFYNSVRLGMHMHSPTWPERSRAYTDGQGVTRKLSSRLMEEYTVDVDYLNEYLHRCMAIALGHSTVQVYNEDSDAWQTKVFMEGDTYEPKWQNEPGHITKSGPATFKFTTTPFDNQNNNC